MDRMQREMLFAIRFGAGTTTEELTRIEAAVRARQALDDHQAGLEMVGWYCAGGHDDGHGGTINYPSVRLDDPCAYAVPMFVLVKDINATIAPGDGSEQWPWNMLHGWVNLQVRVTVSLDLGRTRTVDGLLVSVQPDHLMVLQRREDHPMRIAREVVLKVEDIDPRRAQQVDRNVRKAWDAEFNGIPANTPDNPADQ